jgi:ribosomal-protein-alanine N-acetyltransferase
MAQVSLRPMLMQDIEQVSAIDRLSFALPWPSSAFRYELEKNLSSVCWVAEYFKDGRNLVIGSLVIWIILDEAHIATIAIHPDYRGHGISAWLLGAGLRMAFQRGCTSATLEVRVGNHIAQALYRRFGFLEVGQRPGYYQDNHEDALIMTLANMDAAYQGWLDRAGWFYDREDYKKANGPESNGGAG